jgi:hypothetical protein
MHMLTSRTKVVEFWDSRAAIAFHDAMEGQHHQGGPLSLRYVWDEPELDTVLYVAIFFVD